MATDIVAQLANSLAKTAVGEKELSYKDQSKKWDDAKSGKGAVSWLSQHVSRKIYIDVFSFPAFNDRKKQNKAKHSSISCSPVADVVKKIEDFDGLQALRLEGNTIGVEAMQAIAKALETKSELKVPG